MLNFLFANFVEGNIEKECKTEEFYYDIAFFDDFNLVKCRQQIPIPQANNFSNLLK